MKKFLALMLTVCVLLSVAAIASAEDYYIGISVFDYSNNFSGYIRNGFEFYVKELNAEGGDKITLLITDGENNQATQTERIDTMIARGVQAIIVQPVDSSAADTIVAKAREARIPVIFFNRMPEQYVLESYDQCYYVGSNVVYQGQLQGEMVSDAWTADQAKYDTNGDGILQYVLLKGTPGHSDAEDRVNGFYQGLEASGIQTEELAQQNANWSTATAKDVVDTWIGRYGDGIEMVISGNDAMAMGAVEALRAAGLITADKAIPVIGVNGLPEVSELIKDGTMLGSVLTSPYGISMASIDLAVNCIKGVDATEGTEWELEDGKIVRIPETKITFANVDEAVDAYKLAD